MLHKSFEILDAKADAQAGTFEATVAVFNNVDRGGDRIIPGAFKNTLAAWKASGDPIPVILSHQWDDPMAHIGVVVDAKETEKGLWVKGQLDVNDNDVARQVHRLMQRRSLREFSFGYDVPKGGEKRAKDGANDLTEIDLAEVGPTLKGMNPATELHAVKSALHEQTLEQELQEVKTQLAALKAEVEDLKSKADVTPKETKTSRGVDPLRSRAMDLALDIESDGLRPEPPAKQVAKEPSLADDAAALKTYSRDLMLQVLT